MPVLYGPKLALVVSAARSIEGTVRESGSGKPIADAETRLFFQDKIAKQLPERHLVIRTEADGRFRMEGVAPDLLFRLILRRGRGYLNTDPDMGWRQVQSAAMLDLGDVRTKPQ